MWGRFDTVARDRRRRRQGFDPLASLFESTLSETVRPESLRDDSETTLSSLPPAIDVTDPVFSPPSTPAKLAPEVADETMDEETTLADVPTVELPIVNDAHETDPIEIGERADVAVGRSVGEAPEVLSAASPLPRIESSLSSRAVRPKTAQEVLAELRVHSSQLATEEVLLPLEDRVEQSLRAALPEFENLYIAEASEDLALEEVVATYEAHAARFMAEGRMDAALSASNVSAAAGRSEGGVIAKALVRTDSAEYLVWLDLYAHTLIACFPDARNDGLD